MTTADYQPSTAGPESSYYTTRAVNASNNHSAPGYYAAALPAGGTAETFSGMQSQPRALYSANGSQAFQTHEYGSTDGHPESSSSASFVASRSGSYDSGFPQSVTPESGLGTQVDAYNYMYSQSRGPVGMVTTPPALSPTTGHQNHIKKSKVTASRQRKTKHPYQAFSPESLATAGSTTASNRSKLRSASRTSKNTHHNPPASLEERKSRETHNNVEKQYRNRLNAHFESLLSALPERMQSGEGGEGVDGLDAGDRRVSKAEVLEMARKHIKSLERECAALEGERDELRDNMEKLRWLFGRCEGGNGPPEGATFLDPASMP